MLIPNMEKLKEDKLLHNLLSKSPDLVCFCNKDDVTSHVDTTD